MNLFNGVQWTTLGSTSTQVLKCSKILAMAALLGPSLGLMAAPAQTKEEMLQPRGEAPHSGSTVARWSSGLKEFFGTAFEGYDDQNRYSSSGPTGPLSKVWFTGAEGVLTEVYWPTVDRPQVKDSQFLVTDGKTFLFEERRHAVRSLRWVKPGVPAFISTSTDPKGRFKIEKTIFTDPDRDVLLQHVRVTRYQEGLHFYYLHNPSVGNTPMGDSALVVIKNSESLPEGLYASQRSEAQSLLFTVPIRQASAGFEASNDGYQDLVSDYKMDSHFREANNGNVVTTAWLDLPSQLGSTEFVIALGFASNERQASELATQSLKEPLLAKEKFIAQWEDYQSRIPSLDAQSGDGGKLFRASVAMVKSMEDKSFEGAFVASPSVPWGQHHNDFDGDSVKGRTGGYHLVWGRDLYQMASTFLALNDVSSALASLQFFRRTQHSNKDGEWVFEKPGKITNPKNKSEQRIIPKDGAWAQNMWVDGTPYWSSLQMDQTAYPIMLSYRLWKLRAIDLHQYWNMISRAGDFLARYGPWTAQERWEENFGVSPSTTAAQITGLWVGAALADAMGDDTRAARYRQAADNWNSKKGDNLEAWTFTTTGSKGNGKYYVRIEGAETPRQTWNPDDEARILIANRGPSLREKDVLDGGFLELVRMGLRSAWDFHILETLHEYDDTLRVNTAQGPGFFRYTEDRYNYENDNGQQTPGMLWPFLSGERGLYEMVKSLENSDSEQQADAAMLPYLSAMENFATPTQMLPEQVWDRGERQGQPTGAATPLGWTHGEYIKLLRARRDKANPDAFEIVTKRAKSQEKAK